MDLGQVFKFHLWRRELSAISIGAAMWNCSLGWVGCPKMKIEDLTPERLEPTCVDAHASQAKCAGRAE